MKDEDFKPSRVREGSTDEMTIKYMEIVEKYKNMKGLSSEQIRKKIRHDWHKWQKDKKKEENAIWYWSQQILKQERAVRAFNRKYNKPTNLFDDISKYGGDKNDE